MRRDVVLGLLGLLCAAGFGQQAPVFEAADVHVSPPDGTPSGDFLVGGRLEFRSTTLLRLINIAWGVQADRVAGGPNWLDTIASTSSPKPPETPPSPRCERCCRRC